jgi:putative hydrolase of the HAD superfamily
VTDGARSAPARAADDGCVCRFTAPDGPPRVLPDRADREVRRRRAIWRRAALTRGGITTVVLDIGGVIVPSLFESVALPDFPKGPLAGEPAYRDVEQGRASERAYWADLAERRPDLDIGTLWRTCTTVRHEMLAALDVLLSRFRVVAFTNDMGYWFGPDWLDDFAELRALDQVIEASSFGVLKPDPEAYRKAVRLLGEQAERCLFVDDHQANLDGAEAIGMRTLLFDVREPQESVRALLKRLGVPEREPDRLFRPAREQTVRTPGRVSAATYARGNTS